MEKYEHVKTFLAKYCDVDFKDELKLSSALSYLEEVACSSADELGFGYSYIKQKNCAFMITNIHCEFISPIVLGEKMQVKTWPTPPTHVVFGREYQILSEKDEVCLNATSRWCLVDMQTGRLAQSKTVDNQDYSTYNTTKLFDNVQWKIPSFHMEEGELKFTITIANSEYDHNMHVNNTRYADYCLNCFTVGELAKMRLKNFSISYVKQCKEGETLRFYKKSIGNGAYLTQGVNEKQEIVVQAHIIFEE